MFPYQVEMIARNITFWVGFGGCSEDGIVCDVC